MRTLLVVVCSLMLIVAGCSQVNPVDDEFGERESALEHDGQSCEDRCQQQFHECREAGGGGGPGKSGCAHERNDCRDRC